MFKKIISNPFIFFPLVTLVIFWPISLEIFTVKNDALTYYYPIRTLISDALNNGELPLWTPYVNMGYPLHADMQSGAWNPVIWIFSFLTHYNLGGFHYELLFYLALGAIGFYYLCKEYGWGTKTALIIGLTYECSGFMIDSVQFFACISSACYIPFIFLFFKRLLQKQQVKDGLLMALFLSLLFTGGYPSLFIITGYFLLTYKIYTFIECANKKAFVKSIVLPMIVTVVAFILISLPAIISFATHLSYIDRGGKQSLSFIMENSMPPAAMFSLISPFSTTANTSLLNTDPLMRNVYIGIIPLLFVVYALFNKSLRSNKEVKFFLIAAFLFFGLAWGNYFFLRQVAYYVLPLMNTFRHPALFRFFGVFCLLLIAGFSLNSWLEKNNTASSALLQRVVTRFAIVVTVLGIIFFAFFLQQPGIISLIKTSPKSLLTALSFSQRYLLQLPFILVIVWLFYLAIKNKIQYRYLLLIIIADLFFTTQTNMPITVFQSLRFKEVERLMNRNTTKFPLPDNSKSIEENSLNSANNITGTTLLLEKRIGRNDYYITPGNLSLQDKFYESPLMPAVFKNPVLYFTDTTGKPQITIKDFSANTITAEITTTVPKQLIYLQNNYPGWKAFVDDKEAVITIANTTFMQVNVPAGTHTVIFQYKPTNIIYAWGISAIALISVILLLVLSSTQKKQV